MSTQTPDQILEDLQRGHAVEKNFEQLFEQYHRALYLFFRRRGFSEDESRDLVQEVFLRAYRMIHTYRGDTSPSTWLYGIAANTWRNEIRYRSAQKRSGQEISIDSPQTELAPTLERSPEADALKQEKDAQLLKAIQALPPQMRRTLVLRIYQGLTYKEIGSVLTLSSETVKSHLADGRRRLQGILGSQSNDEIVTS